MKELIWRGDLKVGQRLKARGREGSLGRVGASARAPRFGELQAGWSRGPAGRLREPWRVSAEVQRGRIEDLTSAHRPNLPALSSPQFGLLLKLTALETFWTDRIRRMSRRGTRGTIRQLDFIPRVELSASVERLASASSVNQRTQHGEVPMGQRARASSASFDPHRTIVRNLSNRELRPLPSFFAAFTESLANALIIFRTEFRLGTDAALVGLQLTRIFAADTVGMSR